MLTKFTEKGVKKANGYWPKRKGESCSYADFKVTNKGSIHLNNLAITFLELGLCNSYRFVYHLHYTEWPDFGVPKSTSILRSLISFTDLYSYLGSTRDLDGPIVCHWYIISSLFTKAKKKHIKNKKHINKKNIKN